MGKDCELCGGEDTPVPCPACSVPELSAAVVEVIADPTLTKRLGKLGTRERVNNVENMRNALAMAGMPSASLKMGRQRDPDKPKGRGVARFEFGNQSQFENPANVIANAISAALDPSAVPPRKFVPKKKLPPMHNGPVFRADKAGVLRVLLHRYRGWPVAQVVELNPKFILWALGLKGETVTPLAPEVVKEVRGWALKAIQSHRELGKKYMY